MSPLHAACRAGDTERVRQLLDEGAPVDEKSEFGRTALMWASSYGHTEVVRLLLDKGAAVDEKGKYGMTGMTALMEASDSGHTEVVQLLLAKGAAVDEKNKWGVTALFFSSEKGHTEMVQLLLDKGAALDEKDRFGMTALMYASDRDDREVMRLLLDKGAALDVKNGITTVVQALVTFDEDQLGRMAAAQVQGQLLKAKGQGSDALVTTATAVLQLVHLAGSARERALKSRSSDPRSVDDHQALFGRLQLAAAACVQTDGSGKARDKEDVQKLFLSDDGRKALEHAVQIEAKELLAQPVVQGYLRVVWRENLVNLGWAWVLALLVLLLQLLFVLPRSWHWCHLFTGC